MAERSEGHMQRFKEDEEAVFLQRLLTNSPKRYADTLPDEAARQRIAIRRVSSVPLAMAIYNDRQVQLIVDRAQSILSKDQEKVPSVREHGARRQSVIHDLLHESPAVLTADLCIIGAGAAGITLAVESARRGKEVLLLEGGGATREDSSQALYDSEIAGLPHRGVHTGRIRVKGGTTVRWGGQILELDALDFTPRPGVPDSGWPFPKSTLTPFYERALSLEGLAKVERSDAAVWQDLGLPFTQYDDLEAYLSRWCPEPNFARLHHKTLREHPNIHLWLHASAVELITEGTAAAGLRVRTLTGIEAIFRAPHFIFALGGIESSRFFLQPRHGGLPWNRSGLLGQHFQDHIDCNAAAIEPLDPKSFHDTFDPIFAHGFKSTSQNCASSRKYRPPTAPLTSAPPCRSKTPVKPAARRNQPSATSCAGASAR